MPVTITLLEPLTGHGGQITTLRLREPKARDIWRIGDLVTWNPTPEGGAVAIEHKDRYADYLECCLEDPADKALVLAQVSMADAVQVEKVIDGFFADARRKVSPSEPSSSS